MDTNPKNQIVERLKQAQNVLITVSSDPSVDQLAAAIGLTLMLNKLSKHATAVFSGVIPSTLEFLNAGETLEQDTNSLRDFIISLDKSKADKLRYKVEENVVKIFITPYRTSLSEADLNFSEGDFNVDVVVALGVDLQEHIDQAIVAHGRILHDATVVGVMAGQGTTDVGSINWIDPSASSLCEMLVSISEAFQGGLLDGQMSTAFLTGIVAATDRFSNDKTTPKVMTMSAQLMAAGANQQLISNKLMLPAEPQAPVPQPEAEQPSEEETTPILIDTEPTQAADAEGTIDLHNAILPDVPLPPPPPANPEPQGGLPVEQINIDAQGTIHPASELTDENGNSVVSRSSNYNRGLNIQPPAPDEQSKYEGYMNEPPQMGGTLTANTVAEDETEATVDPLSSIPEAPLPAPQGQDSYIQTSDDSEIPDDRVTDLDAPNYSEPSVVDSLADLEASVKRNEQNLTTDSDLDAEAARKAVADAVNSAGYDADRPEPIQALNAQPLGEIDNSNQPPIVPPPLVPPFPLPQNDNLPDMPQPGINP